MTANVITGRSFKQFYMRIHLLTGFLGSGKTTAIQHASRVLLRKGIRSGVITNDQGHKLVDGDFFKSQGMPSRQVMNGCFCCNYNELNENIQSLIETIASIQARYTNNSFYVYRHTSPADDFDMHHKSIR